MPWRGVSFSTLSTGRFVLKQHICNGAESAEHAKTAGTPMRVHKRPPDICMYASHAKSQILLMFTSLARRDTAQTQAASRPAKRWKNDHDEIIMTKISDEQNPGVMIIIIIIVIVIYVYVYIYIYIYIYVRGKNIIVIIEIVARGEKHNILHIEVMIIRLLIIE